MVSRKFLVSVIVILLITNIITFIFLWSGNPEEGTPLSIGNDGTEVEKASSNEPVATIGKETIMPEEWTSSLRDSHGKEELKSMIDRLIVKQLAHEKNITVHDKVIEREIALLTTAQGIMTEEQREKMEEKWKEDITFRYQLETLLTEDVAISEEDIQAHYDLHHKSYNFTKSLQLSHILVSDMETAEKVVEELDSGASFQLLAQEYSIDEESKDDGGYLGYFTTTTQFLPDGYENQADQMEEDTYSEPFVAERGIAILYLHRSLPEITFTYEELQPYIKSFLALEKSGQALNADPLWDKVDVDWLYGS